MIKIVIAVWIYVAGLVTLLVSAGQLKLMLSVFPRTQIEAFGPNVSQLSLIYADHLQSAPTLLGVCALVTALAGVYLWRSKHPRETRLFAAAVIAAVNMSVAMTFWGMFVMAYFYLPKVANAG